MRLGFSFAKLQLVKYIFFERKCDVPTTHRLRVYLSLWYNGKIFDRSKMQRDVSGAAVVAGLGNT